MHRKREGRLIKQCLGRGKAALFSSQSKENFLSGYRENRDDTQKIQIAATTTIDGKTREAVPGKVGKEEDFKYEE